MKAELAHMPDAPARSLERDLHDGAQQRLVTLLLQVKLGRRDVTARPAVERLLDRVESELAEVLHDLRALALGRHPDRLEEDGLAVALQRLVARAAPLATLSEVPDAPLPPHVEAAVYYLVAEALANVAKHSCASRSRVRVARVVDAVEVDVADDGIGGADPRGGSGLRGLEARVRALGGRCTIDSAPGRGTRMLAVLPCVW